MSYISLNDLNAIGEALESGVRVEAQTVEGYWIDVTESKTINLEFRGYRINTISEYEEAKERRNTLDREINRSTGNLVELLNQADDARLAGDGGSEVILLDDVEWVKSLIKDLKAERLVVSKKIDEMDGV